MQTGDDIYILSTHYLHTIYTLSTLTRGAGAGVWRLDQVLWTLGFSAILVTAILGNTIVLWIITGNVQPEICYQFCLAFLTFHDV